MTPAHLISAILAVLVVWFLWEKSHRKTRPMPGGIHNDISLPYSNEYELYHNDLSLCSKKVRACMAQLGVVYKSHHVDLIETGSYEVISRHYLAVNPAGLLPALVHNGHPIYESHEIIAYVAQRFDGPQERALLPPVEADRALMQLWVDRASLEGDDPVKGLRDSAANCAAILTTPLFCAGVKTIPVHRILEGLLFHRLRFRPVLFLLLKFRGLDHFTEIAPLMTQLDRGRDQMGEHLAALEHHLEQNGPYIVGQQLTLADISWLVIFERLVEADWVDFFLQPCSRPAIAAYWKRLKSMPAYQIGIEQHRHPTVSAATALIQQKKVLDPSFHARLEGRG